MIAILRTLCIAALLLAGPLAAAGPAALETGEPVLEAISSGLVTFAGQDRALRVAVVLTDEDPAVVETTVKFLDTHGTVLKRAHSWLRDGEPLIAQLLRSEVPERAEALVRVVVEHTFPVLREDGYPIITTLQPIADDGAGRWLLTWAGPRGVPGTRTGNPVHVAEPPRALPLPVPMLATDRRGQ